MLTFEKCFLQSAPNVSYQEPGPAAHICWTRLWSTTSERAIQFHHWSYADSQNAGQFLGISADVLFGLQADQLKLDVYTCQVQLHSLDELKHHFHGYSGSSQLAGLKLSSHEQVEAIGAGATHRSAETLQASDARAGFELEA